MDKHKAAQQILEKIGGSHNIIQHWHCITRLRFNLNNNALVNMEALNKIGGVMGVQFQGDQLQIILGNKVADVFTELDKIIVVRTDSNSAPTTKLKQNIINNFFDFLSGVFTPILPAIVGTGLLKGILSLLVVLGWLSSASTEYKVLYGISEAAFYFLPILVAASAAKKFRTHEYLAITLACILLYPSLSASLLTDSFMINELGEFVFANREPLTFFGLNIPNNIDYHASVIPIILGVWLLSYVNRWTDKFVPAVLKIIVSPILVLVITSTIMLIFIAPLGAYLGSYLALGLTWIFNVAGPIAGLIMGTGMALLVITGMHYALFPSMFENFRYLGYDFLLLPISFVSNLAQAGATLAVAIKVTNKEFKSLAYSAALSASLGITEPAMYGVTIKLRKPFYIALIAAGLGGTIVGFFSIKAYQSNLPGLASLPTFIAPDGTLANFFYILFGISVSFMVAFILTLCIKLDETLINSSANNNLNSKASADKDLSQPQPQPQSQSEAQTKIITPAHILAPISGVIVDMSQVPDKMFAQKIIGDGVAIMPSDNLVVAPCNGTISMVAPTKHAVGIISDEGVELLIHVGIDTVTLGGQGFETFVENGQRVAIGDQLLKFDIDFINKNNISFITPIVITNHAEFRSCTITEKKHVDASKDLLITLQ